MSIDLDEVNRWLYAKDYILASIYIIYIIFSILAFKSARRAQEVIVEHAQSQPDRTERSWAAARACMLD